MRITNNMLIRDMLWNANKNLVSMSQRQRELSTGKRIHRPSDDPVGTTLVLKYKTDIREAAQYKKNIDDGLGWMEVTESSMHNIKDILHRIRELAVRGANGTNTPEDTAKIQSEVDELVDELMVLGNSTNAGRYIFSGLETDEKLFNPDGTFNVLMTSERVKNKYVPTYEVAIGETMPMGTHPIDIFGLAEGNSFFESLMTYGDITSEPATQTTLSQDVDITAFPNPATAITVTVGGDTFTVPAASLENIPGNRMTKERLLDALKNAEDGSGVKLSEKAGVFFDANDKLVVQASDFGNVAVTMSPNPGLSGAATVTGTDATTGTKTGTGTLNDADVAAATGTETLVFEHDGEKYTATIDFSTLNTVADLQTALQSAFDTELGAGVVTVNASAGSTLDFQFTGASDGLDHAVSVDYVVATESQMIKDLQALSAAFAIKDDVVITDSIDKLDDHLDTVLNALGEIGGKTNRIEYISSRIEENKVTFTGLLSRVQDVDMAEAIMLFKNLENIYRASLSVGSKVIQPSLVDFIK
ncbi:flagellar hook-associated protein FlgL [Fusibacter sp. JL298sf-3]